MSATIAPANPLAAAEAAAAAKAAAPLTNLQQADKLTHDHILWATGFGLIPMPLVDIAAITGAQIHLISKLSEVYKIPFSDHRAKNLIYPLVSSVGLVPAGAAFVSSLVKGIPVFGTLVGVASMPAVAGATTYAIGKVFTSHFEAGGTLLDFDPSKTKAHFAKLFSDGKQVVSEIKEAAKSEEAAPAVAVAAAPVVKEKK